MSGEIVVSATPNWLNDLEAKREQKLKARLGHEAGAGAPCLKCEDKCPGLDLHFWRKACKICRCPKEEHDVHDDDVYGWAQFQLLGSKPNKIKTKITLPGKKDEVELEWAPKGQKETIDKYLKTLPPETLPVKGSQAAQERKQLLQKQLPIHDIDPALCHELNEEEVANMEQYIDYVKKNSVGVGQIVNLSNVIKANLHNISPHEAHIIASKYATSIPFNEIVSLQQPSLAQNLQSMSIGNKPAKHHNQLPSMQPSQLPVNPTEQNIQNRAQAYKFKDVTPLGYASSTPGKTALNPQYSAVLQKPFGSYSIDEKLLQNTGFDPALTPSQFLGKPPKPPSCENVSKEQCGYENPLFNHGRLPESKAPKSVKDLMYSTYDPNEGPIPQDSPVKGANTGKPDGAPYDPAKNLNTYKHNPGAIPPHIPSERLEPQRPSRSKIRKPLTSFQPEQLTVPEDYLEPQYVNIGSIQDIEPDIKEATTEFNPGYGGEEEYSPESIREIINNVKLPDCHYCKKPFEENEFAVTIDRASVLFHANCFRCAGCNQCLADNIYFYHKDTDNVYCGRDYAKIKGYPRCSACDELIFTKEYCLAESCTFHLKHFCCFLCDTPLAGQGYTSEDDKPYCLPCFESTKAAKCSTCENVIKTGEPGCQLNGVHFHADDSCIRCIVCSVPLMGKKMLLRNEKLFCSHECFNGWGK